jgi:uncharacterized protein (TIGR02246 family)
LEVGFDSGGVTPQIEIGLCKSARRERGRNMDQPMERDMIALLYGEWFAALEEGDIERFLTLLTDDVIIKMPGRPAVEGKNAVRHGLEDFHAHWRERVRYELHEIEIGNGWGYVRLTEQASLTPLEGGSTRALSGMHLAILRRDRDGSWRVARDIGSLDSTAPL